MNNPPPIAPDDAHPPAAQGSPDQPKPKPSFCQWLEDKKIEATINLVIVSFKIPLNCKTLFVVLGLIVVAALILIIPRAFVQRCAYAGITHSNEEAIVWLINSEGEAVVEENMGTIQKIFAPHAVFVDMLTQEKWFSPIERYTHLFDAADYSVANHANIKGSAPIENDRAYFISSSQGTLTANGVKSSYSTQPGSDHWTLEKQNGCWVIAKFEFNAAGIQFP